MKKMMIAFLAGLLASGAGLVPAFAASPASGVTVKRRVMKKSMVRMAELEQFGQKAFEIKNTSEPQLVVDESGTAPTTGVLHRICLSSGSPTAYYNELFAVFDASATLNSPAITINTVGRALFPPMNRLSRQYVCSERIDTQFHRGLVGVTNFAAGGAYVYWSRNGGAD